MWKLEISVLFTNTTRWKPSKRAEITDNFWFCGWHFSMPHTQRTSCKEELQIKYNGSCSYSLFTLRKAHFPLRINVERAFLEWTDSSSSHWSMSILLVESVLSTQTSVPNDIINGECSLLNVNRLYHQPYNSHRHAPYFGAIYTCSLVCSSLGNLALH